MEGGFRNLLSCLETHAHPGSGVRQDPSEVLQSFPPAASCSPAGRRNPSHVVRMPR